MRGAHSGPGPSSGQESGCILTESWLPRPCCVWSFIPGPGSLPGGRWSGPGWLGCPGGKLLPRGTSGFTGKMGRIMHILQSRAWIRAACLSLQQTGTSTPHATSLLKFLQRSQMELVTHCQADQEALKRMRLPTVYLR